jgi:hypothetical protein
MAILEPQHDLAHVAATIVDALTCGKITVSAVALAHAAEGCDRRDKFAVTYEKF